ncbi:hypothetical protein GCM10023196_055990 [Actinoallomurus vinaceus]|uniref:Uncharacterized protein n=1 Tax=Actinoallomurus vinaceus TaxID=1080074 RepID=A0ABP8UGC6_9ACTN
MTTDEVIRQAFERQAENAPAADHVLADLRVRMGRARRRRVATQGVMAVVFSGAAVAAAVWVPSGGPESIGHRVQAGPRPAPVRLLYRPSWLPQGFTEVARQVGQGRSNGVQIRTWADRSMTERPVGDALVPTVDVQVEPPTQGGREDRLTSLRRLTGSTTVDVNGHEARRWHDTSGQCMIAWQPTAKAVLSVTMNGFIGPCADALRVARSIGPDDRATVVPPLRVTWLPTGYATDHVVVSRTDSGCRAELMAMSALRVITAEVGAGRLPSQGTPLRVGGRPARSYPVAAVSTTGEPDGGTAVAVDLGGGRVLTVRDYEGGPALSRQVLGQVAAGVDVGDTAGACTW